MKRLWRLVAWVAGLAVVVALVTPFLSTSLTNAPKDGATSADGGKDASAGGRRRGRRGGGDGPIPVLVAKARSADVPVYVEGVGTGLALNSVLIRSQVDGVLTKLNFVEGQDVKAGDLIAEIDPRLYQATYDQNVAKKAQDEATLANAKRDLERYRILAQTKAGTQQQYDTQKATVAADEAIVKYDQALIDSAATTLSYTKIISPISGRTGIRNVDVGNVIHASDTTGIVTVAQIQPISVTFTVPQQELARINKASLLNQLDVQAVDANGSDVIDHGVLAVVNNSIDATTGTVKLKANFPNPQLQLWPGIFCNVRLRVETLHNAIVVPVGALQRGPKGPFVFTLVGGDTAKMSTVAVDQQDDARAVVTSGVKAGDTIITSGFQKLTDGAKVSPSEDTAANSATATPGLHQQEVTPTAQPGDQGQQPVRRSGRHRNGPQSTTQ